jgi:hypothetical protein
MIHEVIPSFISSQSHPGRRLSVGLLRVFGLIGATPTHLQLKVFAVTRRAERHEPAYLF